MKATARMMIDLATEVSIKRWYVIWFGKSDGEARGLQRRRNNEQQSKTGNRVSDEESSKIPRLQGRVAF